MIVVLGSSLCCVLGRRHRVDTHRDNGSVRRKQTMCLLFCCSGTKDETRRLRRAQSAALALSCFTDTCHRCRWLSLSPQAAALTIVSFHFLILLSHFEFFFFMSQYCLAPKCAAFVRCYSIGFLPVLSKALKHSAVHVQRDLQLIWVEASDLEVCWFAFARRRCWIGIGGCDRKLRLRGSCFDGLRWRVFDCGGETANEATFELLRHAAPSAGSEADASAAFFFFHTIRRVIGVDRHQGIGRACRAPSQCELHRCSIRPRLWWCMIKGPSCLLLCLVLPWLVSSCFVSSCPVLSASSTYLACRKFWLVPSLASLVELG